MSITLSGTIRGSEHGALRVRLASFLLARVGAKRLREWQHRYDLIKAVTWSHFRTEFDHYFLGWLWWFLEPAAYAAVFWAVIALFFHLEGDRLWVIVVSVMVWRWFSRCVDGSAHLVQQFVPYVQTGGVTIETMFLTYLVKETMVFLVAMPVTIVPLLIFDQPISWHLLELPLVFLCQALLIYWLSALSLIVGAFAHDFRKVIGLGVGLWWYFSPGLYIRSDLQNVPEWVLAILQINPFWPVLLSWQNILVRRESADFLGLGIWIAISCLASLALQHLVHRLRRRLIMAGGE